MEKNISASKLFLLLMVTWVSITLYSGARARMAMSPVPNLAPGVKTVLL